MPRGNFNLRITLKLSPEKGILRGYFNAIELGEKLSGGDKSDAIVAARLLRG